MVRFSWDSVGFVSQGSRVDRTYFPADFSEDIELHRGEEGRECPYVPSGYASPDYSVLGEDQVRYYLWWRSCAEAGVIDSSDEGYAWLYCRELIESPGDPRETLARIVSFTRTCGTSLRLSPMVASLAADYALSKGLPLDLVPRDRGFAASDAIITWDLTRYPIGETFPGALIPADVYNWRRLLPRLDDGTMEEIVLLSLRGIDEIVRSTEGMGLIRAIGCVPEPSDIVPFARFIRPEDYRAVTMPVVPRERGPYAHLVDAVIRQAVRFMVPRGGPSVPRTFPKEWRRAVAAAVDAAVNDCGWMASMFRDGDEGYWEDDDLIVRRGDDRPRIIPQQIGAMEPGRPRMSMREFMSHWSDESDVKVDYVPSGRTETTYSAMDDGQLAFYRYWRTQARKGRFLDTDQGYLWLFCTEAVNIDDEPEAIQGMFESALEAYAGSNGLAPLRIAANDHAVLHHMDTPPDTDHRMSRYVAYAKLASDPIGRMDVDMADQLAHYDSSKYTSAEPDLHGIAFTEAVRAVDSYMLESKGRRLVDRCTMREMEGTMRLYKGLWTSESVVISVEFKDVLSSRRIESLIDGIYRVSIRTVNRSLGDPAPRYPKDLPEALIKVAEDAVVALMDRRDMERADDLARMEASRIVLDRDAVESAARDLEAVTGMMAVDDYDDGIEEETPVTPSQDGGWEGLVASLDDAETAYLRDSLTPRGAGPWSLEGTGRRPSEVEDAVNSKAMDAIGDAIVEGGRAVEDYAPDIEGALR